MNKATAILTITLLAVSTQLYAKDRTVKCQIDSNGSTGKLETVYNGSCLFIPDGKNGSFSLTNPDKSKPLTDTIVAVNVSITKKGLAEVAGATTVGGSSRWGEAKKAAKGCWEGQDFKVCAWN